MEGTVVVIEDDPHIADLVALYLRRDGFRVLLCDRGEAGIAAARNERARLVIVDIGLPGDVDGFEVCRTLRAEGDVGLIVLTARDDEVDRILGLELGADDYVTKPFSPRELVARTHAILRRSGAGRAEAASGSRGCEKVAVLGPLSVDLNRHEVRRDGSLVELTTREFELLAYLLANQGLVMSRRQLLDGAWGEDWYGDERTVDVHVAQLRKKLGSDLPLATVRGVGYRLG